MAKNDVVLIDGILDDRVQKNLPSIQRDEVFEFLAMEQILKDYDFTSDEVLSGSIDGRGDGGIDGIFIIVNGHLLDEIDDFYWPKTCSELYVEIITCKHHDTFLQATLDAVIASITELLDFSKIDSELKGKYNVDLLKARSKLMYSYRKLSSSLSKFTVHYDYASRGDSSSIGDEVRSRSNQIIEITKEYFDNCVVGFEFVGSSELLKLYRKMPVFTLELPFQEALSKGERYVILSTLSDYFSFVIDENIKLRRYLFDSNVRDFMGLNRVNEDIKNTLERDDTSDFWWLNNGITILATSARIIGSSIHMEDIQIVNGLQTTESIFNYFKSGKTDEKNRLVLIKIIVSKENDIRDSIIRATNNQTNVELASLHATDKIQRDIEEILFKKGFYYERRINYYKNQEVNNTQIVTPLYLAAGFVCLIMKAPHKAARLKNRFMRNVDLYNRIYSDKTNLLVWPQIAFILKRTDFVLEENRPKNKANTEKHLKNWRNIVSFITISRVTKKFDFSIGDLLKIREDEVTPDILKATYATLIRLNTEDTDKNSPANKPFLLKACKHYEQEDGISGFESLEKWTSPEFDPTYRNVELDASYVDLVDSLLPKQPWKPGIHNSIAARTKSSKEKVYRAIQFLVETKRRYRQKDGVIFDSDGTIIGIDEERVDKESLKLKNDGVCS